MKLQKNWLVTTNQKNANGKKLSDGEVELIRRLHAEYPYGHCGHLGYRKLAVLFGVHKQTIASICQFRRRLNAI